MRYPCYPLKIFCIFIQLFPSFLHLTDIVFGPGPKYMFPDVSYGPLYSIKWRTKFRKTSETPGPYYVKPITDMPAFSMYIQYFFCNFLLVFKYDSYLYELYRLQRIAHSCEEAPN